MTPSLINLFTGRRKGSLGSSYSFDWHGVFRGKGVSATPVFLHPNKTKLSASRRQMYQPGSGYVNDPTAGDYYTSAGLAVLGEGIEQTVCDAIPVPGCSFIWNGFLAYEETRLGGYLPEPDFVVRNGPVFYYYMFRGDGYLPSDFSGAVGEGFLTVYYSVQQ